MIDKKIERRWLGKALLFLLLLPTAAFQMGCNVYDDIKAWVPIGLNAFLAIVTILDGAAGASIAAIVTLVKAGFAEVLADIAKYQDITPPPAGALQAISDALSILVSNLQAFLAAINIPDSAIVTTIIDLAQVILSTILGFQQQLPSSASTVMARKHSMTINGVRKEFTVAPVRRDKKQFVAAFNGVLVAHNHPELQIH